MMILGKHTEAILKYTRPMTKKGLISFLGVVSFYRRYVKLLAADTATLYPTTLKAAPAKIVWSKDMESAFTHI